MTIFLINGCGNEDTPDPVFDAPVLSISGQSSALLKPGDAIEVSFTLDADAGNQTLRVNRGGGILDLVSLDEDATTFTYSGATVSGDLTEGEMEEFEFILIDAADQQSTPVTFTADIAVYDLITVKGEEMYEVAIPADGIVPSGIDVKFSEGRSYYITEFLEFEAGSSLTIEPGVSVYFLAGVEPSTGIIVNQGVSVTIEGTAIAPIVMTSSNILDDTAEPGDWDTFELEGTLNAVFRYVRIEYAKEGLRIDEVDASNTVEYVQSFFSEDEGFYVTDGDIHLKYLVNTKSGDTGFRLGDSYKGTLQFIINQGADHDETDFYIRENATITAANMTLLGPGKDAAEGGDILEMKSSVNLFKIYNTIIAESVDEDLKLESINVTDLDGEVVFAYSYVFNNDDPIKGDAIKFFGTFDAEGNILTNPFFNNAITGGPTPDDFTFEVIEGIAVDDFLPEIEQTSEFDPADLGGAFVSAPFVGAVQDAANDWTIGWVKNPDGTIR
ncbi:MAG: hypothetical protein ACOCXH_04550 [Cyclobacteriaceae bacterium]